MVSTLRGLSTGQQSVWVSDLKRVTIAGLPEGIRLYFPFLVVNTPVGLVSLNGTQIGWRKLFRKRSIKRKEGEGVKKTMKGRGKRAGCMDWAQHHSFWFLSLVQQLKWTKGDERIFISAAYSGDKLSLYKERSRVSVLVNIHHTFHSLDKRFTTCLKILVNKS